MGQCPDPGPHTSHQYWVGGDEVIQCDGVPEPPPQPKGEDGT